LVEEEAVHLIDLALEEDRGSGDWTSRWTIPARTRARAQVICKSDGIVAGTAVAAAVFARIDPRVTCSIEMADGSNIRAGDLLCSLQGPARAVLTGERVALNFLQRLSGIATLTRRFVDAVAGTGVRILDTRKTTPGWRSIEKAAVRAGGAENHRHGLFDMVLIKNNHIDIAGGVAEAVARVREQNVKKLPVEIEVRTVEELQAALQAGIDRLLLDNMDLRSLRHAVTLARKVNPNVTLEASGKVNIDNVREVAEAGVDCISIGALTHSAPALDFSLRVVRA
jgi:nicotinate-nucleotide pyrophosphorylase (carboxylating)